jgi:hypothetical protein
MRPFALSADRRTAILDPGLGDGRLILVTRPPREYVSPPIEPTVIFGQSMVIFEPWPAGVSVDPYLEVLDRQGARPNPPRS